MIDKTTIEIHSNNYAKIREETQEIFNRETKGILFFAFSDKQLNEILEAEGITTKDLLSIGAGGLILKSKKDEFKKINHKIYDMEKEFMKNPYNIAGAYYSELWNHEARISWGEGYDQALKIALSFTEYEPNENGVYNLPKSLLKILIETERRYNYEFDKIN